MRKKQQLLTTGKYLDMIVKENLKPTKNGKPVTRQAIWLAVKEGNLNLLPLVKKIHRIGHYYLLELS